MLEKDEIEEIKGSVDLVSLIESRGIHLKKNGKGYRGLCPFHEDTNPSLSVNPTENLWQCFGCGAGGDAIRFVELFDRVEFKEAVKVLQGLRGIQGKTPFKNNQKPKPTPKEKPLTVKEKRLLAKVASFYEHTLTEDARGLTYLQKERGITEKQSLKDFVAWGM
jgi:DNA primase